MSYAVQLAALSCIAAEGSNLCGLVHCSPVSEHSRMNFLKTVIQGLSEIECC